jgi:ribosomal protein S18 acetylase RimI-like enzyme
MKNPVIITEKNGGQYFFLTQLASGRGLDTFVCSVSEYSEYLNVDALRSMSDHVALTWLLYERTSGEIAAYMSLIADAIKLSVSEKELHNLNYPFKTIPAMKIAKLAVSQDFKQKYRGIGSFMVHAAHNIARACNTQHFAARFLTVDADIEHDEGVLKFYEKSGFIMNAELYNKKRKTISMRLDLYN